MILFIVYRYTFHERYYNEIIILLHYEINRFFSMSKNFSTFSSLISSKKNISTMFVSRCACVFLTSRVIIKIKFTIIIIMFFNLFCKIN